VPLSWVNWINSALLILFLKNTYLGAFAKLRKATVSLVMSVYLSVCLSTCLSVRPSVRMEKLNSPPNGRIFMKFNIWVFFENLSKKFKFHLNLISITGTLREDLYTFLMSQFFLEWVIFQTKSLEKIKTHILCPITFFRKSCRLWDNVEKSCRAKEAIGDNQTRRMRFALLDK
jgi:hypothetical protein